MKNKEIFELFGNMLEEGFFCEGRQIEFCDFCKICGTDKESFDKYVNSQVGLSGDTVIAIYRGSTGRKE